MFLQIPVEDPVASYTPTSSEFLQDHAFFVQSPSASTTASGTSTSLQSRVTSLEAEVSQLREQLGKAKGVNDVMWETVVQKVIASGKEKKVAMAAGGDDEAESERTRKRGRV
jgi:pre-rRNA-processing protein IPI3